MYFLDLAEGISSWAELEARIFALSQESERGEVFEEFCKAFFFLDPVFQFGNVCLLINYSLFISIRAFTTSTILNLYLGLHGETLKPCDQQRSSKKIYSAKLSNGNCNDFSSQ